jgi:hypothetical protein
VTVPNLVEIDSKTDNAPLIRGGDISETYKGAPRAIVPTPIPVTVRPVMFAR